MCTAYPNLLSFVLENKYRTETIDFANPNAVKALNKALLFYHYGVKYWEFPDANLCPPIPGRVDYIHYLADLLKNNGVTKNITVIDIGTGASCIYPILGHAEYNWKFVATDIDENSLRYSQGIISKNKLDDYIKLRHQPNTSNIFKSVLKKSDKFSASICNPPFFNSEQDALDATNRKLKGLKKEELGFVRNFSGTHHELWCKGGEKAFIENYIYESSLFKNQCLWFTILVSKKDLLRGIKVSLKKVGATDVKIINMEQGNKISRIAAWSYSN